MVRVEVSFSAGLTARRSIAGLGSPMRVSRRPRIYRTLRREGLNRRRSVTGEVGQLLITAGLEVVWVYKRREVIDPNWFSLPTVDVLAVVRGRLRVEFADRREPPRILGAGDVLVLPPRTRCRAYRWPRSARTATVFLAIYPVRRRRLTQPSHREREGESGAARSLK